MSASENGDSSSGSGMSAPENGNTGSESEMSAPENGTTGSGSGMSAPENGTTGSGSGISAPENVNTGSGSGMSAPENGSTGSWSRMSAPENCDISSEPRKSVSGNEGAERNEGQTSQLKAHLLLAALLEEKCELTAKDANMAQKLFKELSVHLSDLGVLPSESHVEELKEARLEQKKMLTEIILQKTQDPASPVLGCVLRDLRTDSPQNSEYKSKFDELEELGRGGFGAVYKAKHKLDGIEYAVKKIKSKSSETNEKILREVKVLSGLKHCNIVRYHYSWTEEYASSDCADGGSHDYDTSDGSSWSSEHQNCGGCIMNFTVYIHMELCSDNLKHWLNERNNKLSKAEDNIVRKTFEKNYSVIRQILTGVAFIHASEIIHRDLKPDNIFLSGSGNNLQVKIGDFGLATDQMKNDDGSVVLPPKSQKHTKGVGTKAYASPEQLKSCTYNFKSDMYSIGLIMYEMFHVFNTVTEKSKKFEKLRTKCKCREKFREKLPDEAVIVESLITSVADNRPSAQDLLNLPLFTASQLSELVNLLNSSEPCEGASAIENSDHLSFTAPQLGRIIDQFLDSATNKRSSRENIKKHLQDMVSDLKLNPETNGGSFNSPHTSRERQLEEDELD